MQICCFLQLCIQTVQMPERTETAVMCMSAQHLTEKLFILHAEKRVMKVYSLIQEMIHFRNKSQVPYTPETERSSEFEKQYLKILELPGRNMRTFQQTPIIEKDIIYS